MLTIKHISGIIKKNTREVRKMFENIGRKIKTTASAACWLGIIASLFMGMIIMSLDEEAALLGFLIMGIGAFFSWISSFVLYGFGQLVENSDKLCADINKKEKSTANSVEAEQVQNV